MVDLAMLPGPPGFLNGPWVQVQGGCISGADVAAWPSCVGLLCKFSAFGGSLHWPAGAEDLGHFGVSFLEILILFEQWAGHRLLSEKVTRPHVRAHRPSSISSVPVPEGIVIRQERRFTSSLIRALGKLPGGLGRFLPCSVGSQCLRHGPVRVQVPYLTRSEDGHGPGRGLEMHYTATFWTHPPSPGGRHRVQSDGRGWYACRRGRLMEVRPQERDQRRTVEQIILASMLDVPVPLMEEQLLVDAFAPHDVQVPEQVIEVAKILIDELSARTPVREPQLAEQLVEVPTIISFSSLQRNVEQFVNIPVPRGGVRRLQGFPPEQGSTALPSEQIVDIPVPHGESLHGFLPGHCSASSSQFPTGAADDAFQGVFRTFPHGKKCGVPGRSVRTCPGTSAHGLRRLMGSPGGPMRRRRTSCLLYRYSSGHRRSGPGFRSSSAPPLRREGERGRRGGSGVFRSPRPSPRIAALVFDIRHGMHKVGIAAFTPRAVFLLLAFKPRCSTSRPVWSRRTVMLPVCGCARRLFRQRHVRGWYSW